MSNIKMVSVFIIGLFIGAGVFPSIGGKIKSTIYVPDDYPTIQGAIDNANDGDIIFVRSGMYYENIVVFKTIDLIGEKEESTIIDGSNTADVILITMEGHANISGFTIQNSGSNEYPSDAGIEIMSDENSILNTIIRNNTIGIYSSYAQHNSFTQNTFSTNKKYGMFLFSGSDYTITTGNIFINNPCGLRIKGSYYNTVARNMFLKNDKGMYFCCGSRLNSVYNNTFINNTLWNAADDVGENNWDAGYPTGGNYWDDYSGNDKYRGPYQNISGGDGIGDTFYYTSGTGVDHYPLMKPYENHAPDTPTQPTGPLSGKTDVAYQYTTTCFDQDDDQLWFRWDWGDGNFSNWMGPYTSRSLVEATYTWYQENDYKMRVKAKDEHGLESEWSDPLAISIPKMHSYNPLIQNLLKLLERFPFLHSLFFF